MQDLSIKIPAASNPDAMNYESVNPFQDKQRNKKQVQRSPLIREPSRYMSAQRRPTPLNYAKQGSKDEKSSVDTGAFKN